MPIFFLNLSSVYNAYPTNSTERNNGSWALLRIARGVAGQSGMANDTDSAVAEAACLLQVSCLWPAATRRAQIEPTSSTVVCGWAHVDGPKGV